MPFASSSQTSSPTATRPRSGVARPASVASSVDLPEPDGPMMHVMPGGHAAFATSLNSPRTTSISNASSDTLVVVAPGDAVGDVEDHDADQRRHDRHRARGVLVVRDELVEDEARGGARRVEPQALDALTHAHQ